MDELWQLIRSIPQGKVASYGTVGSCLSNPTSGRAVGRWMANCPDDLPWWRVVSRSGHLPLSKREAGLGLLQESHLEAEGVTVHEGRIDMDLFACWDLEI